MEVDCEGCAGCCIDWRALADADDDIDQERRGRFEPLDDVGNLAPIRRDEVRAFVDAGYGDVLQPRLFASEGEGQSVTVDGVEVAAIRGRPAFLVGLRKPPKPVGPFGHESTWLPTCAFLDPTTLQCRIHDSDLYPATCANYPGENLALDVETECERVERYGERSEPSEGASGERSDPRGGGTRLLDDEPPADADPAFGPGAVGTTVFAHPEPDRLSGTVKRVVGDETTRHDRAEFVAVAGASSPATLAVSDPIYEELREQVLDADSWAGQAIDAWTDRADEPGSPAPPPDIATAIEDGEGAPGTPGWD